MKSVAAKQAKDEFGALLDTAQREPVTIKKKGRPVAVVMSMEEYARLEALENAYWVARADAAAKEGFLGAKGSEKLIKSLLNAKD
jgi:prevent-host-death family protein